MQKSLRERTLSLAAEAAVNFYDLSLLMRQLYESEPSSIREVWERGHFDRRTAYRFLDVGLLIRNGEITKPVAEKIGWTKLQIVTRHVMNTGEITAEHFEELLDIAAATKSRDLQKVLEGKKPKETRAVVFYLTDKERERLWEALISFGAKEKRTGLVEKERALLRLAKAGLTSAVVP